jgi:hypothetical protein
MKKIILPALFCVLIAAILISCGGGAVSDNTKNSADNTQSPDNNPGGGDDGAAARLEPDLPDMDFGGYEFTFFAHRIDYPGDWVGDGDPRELVVEEENSEPINDSVYKRNMKIMDKYNIDIKMITNSNDLGTLKKAVGAGDDIYDAAVIFNNNVPGVVTADLLVNVERLPYVNLKNPWWDPAVNAMSIGGKNYLMAGDLLILDNEATNALLFNKDMMASFGIDLPYGMVKEGKWTMDKMNEIIKGTAADLNGDGKMGDEDQWGLCVYNDSLHALFVSGGGTLAAKNENDLPYMDFVSPKNLAVFEKVTDLMYNPDYVINISGKDHTVGLGMFEENRVLFYWMRMRVVEFFRGMESNFGIIPLPKYDEAQDSYHSVVNPYTGVLLGVPKSAEDLERTSVILEALSAEGRYTLRPAYYDVVLQRKYTRDDESSDMLDIIFNSRVYDIGGVYSFGNVWLDFINLAAKYDKNIVSFYEKKIGAIETAIDKVVTAFQSMD